MNPVELSLLKEKMNLLQQVCIAPQPLIRMKDKFFQLQKIEMMIMLLLIRKAGEIIDPKKICSRLKTEDP